MSNTTDASLQPKKKKKWLWIAGGVVLLFIIIAAAGGGDDGGTSGTSGEAQSSASKVYALDEEVDSSGVIWKVTGARDRGNTLKASESRYGTYGGNKTTAGKYIEVTFTVENTKIDLASITEPKLIDGAGREFSIPTDFDLLGWIPEDKSFSLISNLNPNVPKEFVVIYEVPADATDFNLKVGVLRPQLIDLGF
jgi:hypothetical protein